MKPFFLFLLAFAIIPRAVADDCCDASEPVSSAAAVPEGGIAGKGADDDALKRHPLKGVVIDVLAGKSALLVKHEEIPGVMKAMTMLLTVDAPTLKSPAATKGTAITGQLVRKAGDWWLEDVKVVTPQSLP